MKISIENGPELSFILTGELLGDNKALDELPTIALQLLDTHFTTDAAEVSIFESNVDDKRVYTALLINGYQIKFDTEGNWLSLKGDSLPTGITAILPGAAKQTLEAYSQGDITSISRINVSSTINVSQAYAGGTGGALVTFTSSFDAEGNWLVLEDPTSGLPTSITTLLPESAKNLLTQYFPTKIDFSGLRKVTQAFGLDMVDLITVSFRDNAKYTFNANDGSWFQFNGALPKGIENILPEKIHLFIDDYMNAYVQARRDLIRVEKEARVTIVAATADTTVTYFNRVVFQDNSYLSFYVENDEWANIIANNLTGTDENKLLALLPFESQMYLSTTFGTLDPKPGLNKVEKETVIITTNTGTVEEPVWEVDRYPAYRVSYFGGAWARFNITGEWRTVNSGSNTTKLPLAVQSLLPADLIAYIAVKGWNIEDANLGVSYVNIISETLYEIRFVQDNVDTFVRFDLLVDPNAPEEEPAE
jgi:hypothetical protein